MNIKQTSQQGYSLIELMIVVAIIGILSAIAVPSYKNYIQTSCMGTAEMNLTTLRAFLENYQLEYNKYIAGTESSSSTTLSKALKWNADDKGEFSYKVEAGTTGISNSYKITVTGLGACVGTSATGDNE